MTTSSDDRMLREQAYSPSSCIGGNYQPFIDAYQQRSQQAHEQALSAAARWLDVRYGSAPAQRMDLYLPAAPDRQAGAGVLVFIHGGYWQELSARDSRFAAAQCVKRGLAFCAVDYTLAPAASVASIVAECRAALLHLATHASTWGIDPARIVVAGSSAGAHLAAMVCLAPWRQGTALQPHAAVLLSGVYELQPLIGTSINDALALDEPEARAQSPLLQDLRGFVPAVVAWGQIETEAFKGQSRHFAHALQSAGGRCSSLEVCGRNHFDVALDLADPDTELGRRTLSLFGDAPP